MIETDLKDSQTKGKIYIGLKKLAESSPWAKYKLAKLFPKNSPLYQKTMQSAADDGLPNAKLEMGKYHLAKKNIKEAAPYIEEILRSNDSFIKDEAKKLLKENPALAALVSRSNDCERAFNRNSLFAKSLASKNRMAEEENSTLKI